MIKFQKGVPSLYGPAGSLAVKENDEITLKLAMLVEGHCEGLGSTAAAQKFGYSRQRYYQIMELFKNYGAEGLKSHKTGPKSYYRRTHEVVRQVIRYRYLDPNVSPEVIAQKLNQNGFPIAIRSVERVLAEYGLQKKTSPLLSRDRPRRGGNSSNQR
jgi:transposase